MMRRDNTSSFYHYDALGSTFDLTDAEETVTDTYLYNAWGEILNRTGITRNPHAWVGKERYYQQLEALLYQLGVRYYAARVGRLLSVDPLREGTDWYLMYLTCRRISWTRRAVLDGSTRGRYSRATRLPLSQTLGASLVSSAMGTHTT